MFDVNCLLLLGEEGSDPAVEVSLRAVPPVVLLRGNDQCSRRFRHIVPDGIGGVVVHKPARLQFLVDRVVYRLLLFGRERAPEVFAFRLIEMRHSPARTYQKPKFFKIHKNKFFLFFLFLV